MYKLVTIQGVQQRKVFRHFLEGIAGRKNPGDKKMAHVFISYVHENEQQVQRLLDELTRHGIEVWLDKTKINPGQYWKVAIAEAIDKGDFFVACFSEEYSEKGKRYMNEEITLAIEQLRQRGDDATWFIPVLFSGEVPPRRIDASRKLTDIHWVELNEANWDNGIQQILRVIQPPIHLRSEPIDNLSEEAVEKMLQERDFFDVNIHWDGQGLLHRYEDIVQQGQKLLIDHTTSLTWQQSGPPESMEFKEAQEYIRKLKNKKYAGYSDWRLPTLEEAMSLIEPTKNKDGLYIAPIFHKTQHRIWTADKYSASSAWVVYFSIGYCNYYRVGNYYGYVRAVR